MISDDDDYLKVTLRPVIQTKELTFKLILLGDSSKFVSAFSDVRWVIPHL